MFKVGDRVSFTGYNSFGVENYKARYTVTSVPDRNGFIKARYGNPYYLHGEVKIHISGCKRLVKKNGS